MGGRRGFTLIELLVVVAIIALLVGMLVPALAGARAQARRTKCQANLRSIGHAVHLYLDDQGDVFPEAPFYGCLGYVGRSMYHMLLGSQIPEEKRPLNAYFGVGNNPLPTVAQTGGGREHAFECPSDKGDGYFKLPGKYFVEHGTSYTYASDCAEPFVPVFGIMSCRSLPLTKVKYPAKKIVFQEPVFNPSFDMSDPKAHWHHDKRHHGNLLFVDGHVSFMFTTIFWPEAVPDENEPYY